MDRGGSDDGCGLVMDVKLDCMPDTPSLTVLQNMYHTTNGKREKQGSSSQRELDNSHFSHLISGKCGSLQDSGKECGKSPLDFKPF